MKAFKGFTPELWSKLGDRQEETCQFKVGETKEVPESKTAKSGFHCCENPFECLAYYSFDGKNRFFKVEASGDIDEDGNERIACTKITLLEELTPVRFALEGMNYIIQHPDREKWQQDRKSVTVGLDEAQAEEEGHIAIARGKAPRVKGPEGSILGLIVDDGEITDAKLIVVKPETADRWLTLTDGREVQEA